MDHHPEDGDAGVGRAFLWLAAIGVLAGLTWMFQLTDNRGGLVRSSSEGNGALVVLQRDDSGHYVVQGEINGRPVMFLVDTGATDVAVPSPMARELGLEFGPQITALTAAGPTQAWMTRLDQVSVGSVSLNNVRATITKAPMNEALLGMSFLKHFRLLQQGEELIIESGGSAE